MENTDAKNVIRELEKIISRSDVKEVVIDWKDTENGTYPVITIKKDTGILPT